MSLYVFLQFLITGSYPDSQRPLGLTAQPTQSPYPCEEKLTRSEQTCLFEEKVPFEDKSIDDS